MHRFLLVLLLVAALPSPVGAGLGQKKKDPCEQGPILPRNWEQIGRDYIYFDYVLCPADVDPPSPLVRIWITTQGNGFALEKWAGDRQGADVVAVFYGKKRSYTLYRDLKAIPLKLFKAERRSGVPDEISSQPFLGEGVNLIPLENLTPESAKKIRKVFENADVLIKTAEAKKGLLPEAPRMGSVTEALNEPMKEQK